MVVRKAGRSNTSRRHSRRVDSRLVITRCGERRHYLIVEFGSPGIGLNLLDELQEQIPSVPLIGLLDWPDRERYQGLKFMAALEPRSIRSAGGRAHSGLLAEFSPSWSVMPLSSGVNEDAAPHAKSSRFVADATEAACN